MAASEWYAGSRDGGSGHTDKNEIYTLPKGGETLTRSALIEKWAGFCDRFPILSIEDGLDQSDF